LDECVIAGAAPGFPIQTWFGENTNQSFIDLITSSTHYEQKPVSLSCSWGSSSDGGGWTAGVMASMNAAFIDASNNGIGVFCAAGDGGSTDGEPWGKHLDFPAESPYVTACGGTRLTLGTFNIRDTETVWEINGATGGGVSQNFGVPCYQQGVVPEGTKGRCIPDIAANADPETGYLVKVGLQDETPIGGTSAVAPLMAALHARLQTYFKTRIGSLNPYLYSAYKADRSIFFDVQSGSNGAYHAGPGFDMCTGLGVPDGTKLLKYLQSVIPAEQQF
jgi:kumamolisin